MALIVTNFTFLTSQTLGPHVHLHFHKLFTVSPLPLNLDDTPRNMAATFVTTISANLTEMDVFVAHFVSSAGLNSISV